MAATTTQALTFTNTIAVLNEFGKEVVEAYKKGVVKYDAIASHSLLDKVSANVPQQNGSIITVSINLMEYWKFVEAGRQAGKMPPVSAIEQWLSYKHILPGTSQRGVPSYAALTPDLGSLDVAKRSNNLAWAIATNIKKYGIKPKPILRESVSETLKAFEQRIAIALADDVGKVFAHIAGSIWTDVKLEPTGGEWKDIEVRDNIIL